MRANVSPWRSDRQRKSASKRVPKTSLGIGVTLAACTLGCTSAQAQVQNISGWTLDWTDSPNITVGGITYLNNYATPTTVTTSVGTYDAGTAGAGADSVFIRRNTATPTSTSNVNGQAVSSLSATSNSSTVYGTYHATMQELLLGGNILNSTWDTFANTSSGAGGVGHNIERIDFVWSSGYTVVGDEVIIVFNFDPIGQQDDFRIAVFTGVDDSPDLRPTSYANTGVLVTGTSYPDKLPLPLTGSPLTSPSTGFRTTGVDDLSGTALNRGDSQTAGIGGVAINLASLGVTAGQTIYGYSLISGDTIANTAEGLVDFTNSSIYLTNTANADASGTADFSTFGGRIASLQVNLALGAFEWDNESGTSKWGTLLGGEANTNWFSTVTAENNRTPLRDSDVIFGKLPSTAQTVDLDNNVKVRKMTFDSAVNYTIGLGNETHAITFGDPNLAGLPSIDVVSTTGRSAQHKINANINLLEAIAINNNSYSVLCLNGTIETRSSAYPGGNAITVTGTGAVNFNGDISGSGDLVKFGHGITTINNNNSDDPTGDPTPWLGNIAVNEGQLVITTDGALGGSAGRATNANRTTGANTLQISNNNAADLKVGQLVTGTGIPAGTFIVGVNKGASNTTITLSNALTANNNSGSTVTFAGVTTVNSGGTLTLRPNAAGAPVNYTIAETIILNGLGHAHNTAPLGALYNDGGNNTLGSAVSIRLGSDSAIGSRSGNLTISGVISGAHSLTKVGQGVVTLGNAANTYTGATIIRDGVLRITNIGALPGGFASTTPSGGNLTLAGGVLEIGTATAFTRTVGTAADQVQWTGDGGFSAFDAATPGLTRTVTLGGSLIWGSGAFVQNNRALLLSSDYANGTLNFTNAINLGGQVREVRVANGSAVIDGQLSGILSNGGLNKTGAGTLELAANNSYTGVTQISGGALRVGNANQIDSSDLVLNGGVLEINTDFNTSVADNGDFTRTVGTTGADDVRWTGDGGFSAAGANREVRLNNGTAAVTWGGGTPTSGFVGADNALILGSVSSGNTVTLANALVLGGTNADTRTIRTVAGTTAGIANGTLSGVVSGSANLAVTGNGRLDLTAANSLTGSLSVVGAEVRLGATNGSLGINMGAVNESGVTAIAIRQGGTLTLDNATNNNTDRVRNTAAINLAGGTINFLGAAGASSETIGTVTLSSGANTINVQRNGTNSSQLTLASLVRNAGATVNFTNAAGAGTFGNTGNNPRVVLAARPDLDPGNIYAFATVNGLAFAGSSGATNGRITSAAFSGTINETTARVLSVASGTTSLTANRTHNALRLFDDNDTTDSNLNLGGFTLTLNSGGLISTRDTTTRPHSTNTISNGTLVTSGGRELITHVTNSGTTNSGSSLNISATIGATGNTGFGLTKSGDGTLTLSGTTANSYTGVTTVNDGVLVLAKTGTGANSIAVKGDGNTATHDIIVGDGRGIDILRLGGNEQIADDASVKLVGGEPGNTLNVARLELGGAGTDASPSRIETFHTLEITGNSVLDFGGGTVCSPTYLALDRLITAPDSRLTITNWIEFTDFLLVSKDWFDTLAPEDRPRIIFDGYPGIYSWKSYNSQYYQITPVPEPASFGLLSLGGLIGFISLRRRRRAAP